jgi:hypothetical protein
MDAAVPGRPPISLPQRLAAAFPDLLTGALFAWCWVQPTAWRRTLVAELMMLMLVEFLVVHSGPFIGGALYATGYSRAKRTAVVLGFGAFYMLFAAGFAYSMGSWLPILIFAWLIAAKLASLWFGAEEDAVQQGRAVFYWGASAVYYVLVVFVTLLLPVPKLGIRGSAASYGGSGGSGEWEQHPETVLAAGLLYFGLLAITKLRERRAYAPPKGTRTD